MLRCLRLYQLPALSVLLFPVPGLFLREAPARLLLLRAVWRLPVRAAPVRWSVPYPVPFGFLQNARLWYQSASRLCCGLFQESLSVLQVLFRCSTRRYTQKNSPTYQARNVGRQHRRRFPPVPRGCGGRGVPAWQGRYHAAWRGRFHGLRS
ncbi:Uncharacterised protein [Clostridioides difficile]|nr:Uncharacterised protein [Clostridioides difficile]VFH35011.1 Uncharacterised protein [Clostridioides difficile]VFH35617.1 Uncharacterised protein [Clostridioides difficile]